MTGDVQPSTWRLPAEWERQSGVMLVWPPADLLEAQWRSRCERVLTHMARLIAECQPVLIVYHSAEDKERVMQALQGIRADRLFLCQVPVNDIWIRDYGPLTVMDKDKPVLLDFRFNGWGGRFAADRDDQVTTRLHEAGVFGEVELHPQTLHVEGGGIDSNGQGYVLAHYDWPLAGTRNSDMDRSEFVRVLENRFNSELLWVRHGRLPGDDTDDHVDMLARFSRAEQIVYATGESGELSEMQRALWILCANSMPSGCEIVPLPIPRMTTETPHPASYVNFLILNECVLVPQYGDSSADRRALDTLSSCFPERDCVGVDSVALWEQGGGPHCASMQLPDGISLQSGVWQSKEAAAV